jgi:nitrile hydratase subunit beta
VRVASAFDLGGASGFGAVDTASGDRPFHHEWEARVFALNRVFLQRGTYTLDEFRDAIERMDPHEYREASYYERWLVAIETLLEQKGALPR